MSDADVPMEDEPKKKKGTKRKGKDGGPKKPLSAYMLFCQAMRPEVRKENPNADFSEVGKILGAKWQTLKPSEKLPYEKAHTEAKEKYAQEKKDAGEDEEPRAKKTKGGKSRDPKAPKKPKTAFMFFSDAQRAKMKDEGKELGFAEAGKLMGEQWRACNDEEKKPFQALADADKKEYEKKKAEFEAQYGPAQKKVRKTVRKTAKKDEDEGDDGGDDDGDE